MLYSVLNFVIRIGLRRAKRSCFICGAAFILTTQVWGGDETGWEIKHTGRFKPFDKMSITMGDGDDIYFFNPNDPWIEWYRKGQKMARIGGRGRGPGEFQMVLTASYVGKAFRINPFSQKPRGNMILET